MHEVFFSFLFAFDCFTTITQNTIDGNWKGSRETPNGTFETSYTFKMEGTKLKGTRKTQFR